MQKFLLLNLLKGFYAAHCLLPLPQVVLTALFIVRTVPIFFSQKIFTDNLSGSANTHGCQILTDFLSAAKPKAPSAG
ncbi:MAG: hypothetical protein K0U59_06885 [Gammaproteobacteria bacterium]|nr:hypothetical protein [Gammaproteobacteria bacterium]